MYYPPLTSAEENLVTSHRRILHLRGVIYFLGFSGSLVSFFLVLYALNHWILSLVGLVMSLFLGVCTFVDYFVNLHRKCNCQQIPLLSLRARRGFAELARHEKLGWRGELQVHYLIFLLLFSMIGIPALICNAAHIPFLWYMAYLSGTILFLMALRFRQNSSSVVLVASEEMDRIGALTGSTEDELRELINFHSYIGNLDRADHYSQKLLALVEERVG